TALVMATGAIWLWIAGPWFTGGVQTLLRKGLTLSREDITGFDPAARGVALVEPVLLPLAVLAGMALAGSIAAPALLGSLGFRASGFAPKPSKLNPATGLTRMFGSQGLSELGKSVAKVLVLGAVGWWLMARSLGTMAGMGAADLRGAASAMGAQFLGIVLWLTLGLGVIGLIDAPIQLIRRNARLRMTKNEVKEEMKESEGSPETKHLAKQRRHDILGGSARRAVTEATVVLTNPTHFAVALRYRPGIDAVPMVVARGRGETALAIRALAREADVPQLDYPQLTRAIYFTARAGQPIAQDLYLAVATVLAFVFNLDRAMAEGIVPPEVAVPPAKRFDAQGRKKE
ncbi:MAG: flagellar biosynthesis protein FlhB, partial [Sphingomonadaceae bacterium]